MADIDWKKVDDLMIAGCLGTEIASYFGIHPETFYKRVQKEKGTGFSEYLHKMHSKGEAILRAHQYSKSLGLTDKGDNTLLIWLGKTRLKQKEHEDQVIAKEVEAKFDQLMKQMQEDKENNDSGSVIP